MMNGATSLMRRTRIMCISRTVCRGQQHDEESGLYYNRHRYYDPLQGAVYYSGPDGG